MWSLIRANRWKSAGLIAGMALLFVIFGFALAATLDPSLGPFGVIVAIVIWAVMMLTAVAAGEKILLAQAGAREIDRQGAPQLFNVVEEMAIASGLRVQPKIYLIDSPVPNAFAVGLSPKRSAVAVTTGLLARLDRDELQGVVGHEIAHIVNRDTLFMTLAGVTLGAIIMLADVRLRGVRFSSSRSSRNSGGAGAILAIVALLIVILAPILARLLYFACSRRREYLADACSAQFTRYPDGLASALEKISGGQVATQDSSRVLAPMYIVSPLAAHGGGASMFSTHPPAQDRIRVLRGIGKNASLAAYEDAYRALHADRSVVGARNLRASVDAPVRDASAEAGDVDVHKGWRQAREALRSLDGLLTLACACGLRTRLPPGFNQPTVKCPKCGTIHSTSALSSLPSPLP
ncbi:MAG TPA: M48 family metalloprotease [Kiritimatiellia bacterium]|jgi:heat shock protein HtpX